MGYFGKYLSKTGAENLKHYQYKGSDDSLLLKYVLRPFQEGCMKFVPMWVAPNVITVVGLAQIFIVHLIQARYSPDMTRMHTFFRPWTAPFCMHTVLGCRGFVH